MRCIYIGLLCFQENVANRPTIASVILMLNSYSITLPIPLEPAFFMNSGIESNIRLQWENDSRVIETNQSKSSLVQDSINEVSITELSPRYCLMNLKFNTTIFLFFFLIEEYTIYELLIH